jgi:hypothetical protein
VDWLVEAILEKHALSIFRAEVMLISPHFSPEDGDSMFL